MNPCQGKALVVSSYTHPEYAVSMGHTFELIKANALLLRGTEGEVVADPRRLPQMEAFIAGIRQPPQPAQTGTLATLPELPKSIEAASTAAYIRAVVAGEQTVPTPIALQVEYILQVASTL